MKKAAVAKSLTNKQAAFVREYLVDKNATQAAIRAGYSPKTAASIGEENLKKPEIRAAVDASLLELAERVGITAEMVLRERKRIAFFDARKLLDNEGNPLPMQELDDDTAAAIAGLEVVQMSGGDEIPGVISLVKKYRFATKDTSLAALEKYLGLNEKPMRFALPKIQDAEGCTKAQAMVINAVATGALLLSEARLISDLVDGLRKAYETHDLASQMQDLQEQFTALKERRT